MQCPRIYKGSFPDCKIWALKFCCGISTDVRNWLKSQPRRKHSSWMCHAGLFGILRKIYEATGRSCTSSTVSNLITTLQGMTQGMRLSQSLVHTVNGKVV